MDEHDSKIISDAERLAKEGRLDEARSLLEPLLNKFPNNVQVIALACQVVASPAQREALLKRVFELSDNVEMANWALKELDALQKFGGSSAVAPPPLAMLELSQSRSPRVGGRPPLNSRVFQFGLAGLLLGCVALGVVNYLQVRAMDLIEKNGADFLIAPLRMSVLIVVGSLCLIVVSFIAILAGIFMPIFKKKSSA